MLRALAAMILCLLVGGCSTAAYYAQAVEGHLRLMAGTRPIPDLLADAATDPALRRQLDRASAIREFASRELALPDNRSYRSYADLERPFVVWNHPQTPVARCGGLEPGRNIIYKYQNRFQLCGATSLDRACAGCV